MIKWQKRENVYQRYIKNNNYYYSHKIKSAKIHVHDDLNILKKEKVKKVK